MENKTILVVNCRRSSLEYELFLMPEEINILKGKVERIADFGAFISLPKGGEGLLHISKISKERVNKVTDVLNVGQDVEVKVIGVKKDRIELSMANIN